MFLAGLPAQAFRIILRVMAIYGGVFQNAPPHPRLTRRPAVWGRESLLLELSIALEIEHTGQGQYCFLRNGFLS